MSPDHVIQWRLIIEEYGQDIKYIPSPDNVVADALSQLPMVDKHVDVKKTYPRQLKRTKHTEDVNQVYPLDIAIIAEYQKKK